MKQKTTATIIILTLILITSLLLPNQNTIIPITTTTTPTTKNTPITGQGADTNATLIITGNTTEPGQADTESGFNIPCPQGWGILNTTLTITNITAPNATIKTGERPGEVGARYIFSLSNLIFWLAAMSFQVTTTTATLRSISVYLDVESDGGLVVSIVSSKWNSTTNRSEPDIFLVNKTFNVTKGRNWWTFEFNEIIDSSATENRTFFIVLSGNYSGISCRAYWSYVVDDAPYDDGYAYSSTSTFAGIIWIFEDVDFRMRLVLDPGPVYPSEVGLSVNRTDIGVFPVVDVPGQRGNGTCVITAPTSLSQDGYVYFNASANYEGTVYFNVSQANSTLYRHVAASTSYAVSQVQSLWNVTVDAAGDQGFPEIGVGRFINVSIPADWWNTTPSALNETGGESGYLVNASGMLLFEATNGTWIIQCGGPNVLSSLTIYSLCEGFSPVSVSRAVVGDNLTVRGALTAALSGKANLTVLKDGGKVFENQTVFGGGTVDVGWFNVSVKPGSYVVRLLVECGLEVGLIERSFSVSDRAPCSPSVFRIGLHALLG
ncbi:MAG: hypothetical protein QXW47_03080 [Candidatus Jordarchaeales archaeon]